MTGLLFAVFYALTALATVAYYRRRVFSSLGEAVVLGISPLGAVEFLVWALARTLSAAPAAQVRSLAGVIGTGVVVMVAVSLPTARAAGTGALVVSAGSVCAGVGAVCESA